MPRAFSSNHPSSRSFLPRALRSARRGNRSGAPRPRARLPSGAGRDGVPGQGSFGGGCLRSREHSHRCPGGPPRRDPALGGWQLRAALPEFSQSLSGNPQRLAPCESIRPAVGWPVHGEGIEGPMAVKPIYAAGLDAGSRQTRLVICVLENSRIRFVGASAVESQGWAKGRIADQQAVAESVTAALRDADGYASGALQSVVVGMGGPTAVSYTHLRAHETRHDLVCRLLLEKK